MKLLPLIFGRLGLTEILIIVLLVVLFFGGRKIPELMRGMGRGLREFKDAVNTPSAPADEAGTNSRTQPTEPAPKAGETDDCTGAQK